MDTALPGKHTRTLYDTLKRREASVLAQLRTGIPPPDWRSNRIGSMRMRPSKGNRQAFLLPMREMGCIPNTNASTDRHKTRQPLLLFEGESTIWPGDMDTKHGRGTSNDQVRHFYRATRDGGRASSRYPTTVNLIPISHPDNPQHPHVPSTLVSPAGLASVADDRTLNTWRNDLQAHLLLTTHETSFDQGNY